jgi:phosphoribosyl-ATP pyrophosphohydrolase
MNDILNGLYAVVTDRKDHPSENSYTCYLFEKGLDKILKKVGEESAEVIIAAKNGNNADTVNELGDLVYHLLVLMAQQGIKPDDLYAVLEERSKKSGNLKVAHQTDKNS